MPNGGLDNCGVCGFNRANEGVWGREDYASDERLNIAFCTIRGAEISNALWTYCANCDSREPTPNGPICRVGLHEETPGYLYARIPWHGLREPKINVPGTCSCGRFAEQGIAVATDDGEKHFCCNGHYVIWWRQQHPNESYKWDCQEWPEPPQAKHEDEAAQNPPAAAITTPARCSDAAAGASVLLAALAVGFALCAMWVIHSAYERYRGRTDLDMPDWFVINMDLTVKVLPLGAAACLCLLVSAGLFLAWAGRAGWVMRAAFVVQWLVSATIVGLVVLSRLP